MERPNDPCFWLRVTNKNNTRGQQRAARLHQEALNCLKIAVTADEESHSADLIDEALKLAKRSRELNGAG